MIMSVGVGIVSCVCCVFVCLCLLGSRCSELAEHRGKAEGNERNCVSPGSSGLMISLVRMPESARAPESEAPIIPSDAPPGQ